MKSTKYQLLEDDFKALQKDIRMYGEVIESQRKQIEQYKKVLKDIAVNCGDPSFKYVAKRALEQTK